MRKKLARRPFGRRIIAIAAAYAICLSGLIASFGTARAAAEAAGDPGLIICHTESTAQPGPSTGGSNGNVCASDCCIGCLTLLAPVPPPPATAVPARLASSQSFAALATFVPARGPEARSHRSRAPPQTA